MSDVLERVEEKIDEAFDSIIADLEPVKDDGMGDAERFSHYCNKDDIVESSKTGKAIRAACGKMWTPNRSPEGLPICPECKHLYDEVMLKE